jgi:hypothetical protein
MGWLHQQRWPRAKGIDKVAQQYAQNLKPVYLANRERVDRTLAKLPASWTEEGSSISFTKDLLALIREVHSSPADVARSIQKSNEAAELALAQLAAGKARAGAVWDAIHLAAGEIMMCSQGGGIELHANTSANALHYAFQASAEPANRLLILLQGLNWMCMSRLGLAFHQAVRDTKRIDELAGVKISDRPEAVIDEILAHLPNWHANNASYNPKGNHAAEWQEAANKAFTFAKEFPDPKVLVRAAYRVVPLKASWDPHEIKFPVAAWENFNWVSPEWRPHMLAVASYSFMGRDDVDTDLAKQVREAMRNL